MTHWIVVFWFELRQNFTRKAYLFFTFGVPLLAVLAFAAYQLYQDATEDDDHEAASFTENLNTDTSLEIGYVDQTPEHLFPSPASYEGQPQDCTLSQRENQVFMTNDLTGDAQALRSKVIKRVTSPYCWRDIVRYYESYDAGRKALDNGEIDGLYVVDPDYAQTGNLSAYMAGFNLGAMENDQAIRDYLLASLLYNTDASLYERLYIRLRDPAVITEHTLTRTGQTEELNESQDYLLVYGFGLLTMLGIFWGGGYLMQNVVKEKESRIIEIIMSSTRPTALLFGKILAMALLSIVQLATLIGTFVVLVVQAGDIWSELGDIQVRTETLAIMPIYFVLGFLFFGSLMAAVGAVTASMRDSQNFVPVITLPAAIPFFFMTQFAEEPNSTLAKVFSMIPITSPLAMIMRASVTDVPVLEIVLSLALLAGGVVFAIWLSGRLFRVNTLLMGNTPKLRDIPKLLRD